MTTAYRPAQLMQAAQYHQYGPPAVLRILTVPVPTVRPGHVLVKVAATSVNAADLTIRSGKLRRLTGKKFPRGTGFDFSGEVVAVADDVEAIAIGDAVWGFLNGIRQGPSGAAAEYVAAPMSAVTPAPRSLDLVSAAALPGAAGSALAVLHATRLRAGERILIRGAGGGVGTAAVQLARAMGGHVTALARAAQHDALRTLGAEVTIDYRTVAPAALDHFDVIVDTVGTGLAPYRRLLNHGGRYANMALGGPRDLAYMAASVVFGRRRVRFVQAPPDRAVLADLVTYVDDEALRPVIAARYGLASIDSAHRAMGEGGSLGKHVVEVGTANLEWPTAASALAAGCRKIHG